VRLASVLSGQSPDDMGPQAEPGNQIIAASMWVGGWTLVLSTSFFEQLLDFLVMFMPSKV
jgi:hypothetical protein